MLLHDHFKLTWLRLYSCTDISHSPGCICTPARTFHSDLIALILLPIHFTLTWLRLYSCTDIHFTFTWLRLYSCTDISHAPGCAYAPARPFQTHLIALILLHGHFTLTWLRLYSCTDISHSPGCSCTPCTDISPWPNCAYTPARTFHIHLVTLILLHGHIHTHLVALILLHGHFTLTWLRLYSCTDTSHSPGCACTPARTFQRAAHSSVLGHRTSGNCETPAAKTWSLQSHSYHTHFNIETFLTVNGGKCVSIEVDIQMYCLRKINVRLMWY